MRLGEWDHKALGFVAHVPHYLAQLDYPRASVALLEQVELAARLTIDLTDLGTEADEREEEIARYLAANSEVDQVVTALEQQYDAFARAEARAPACSPRTSPSRRAKRSGSSSSSSWPDWSGRTRPEVPVDPARDRGASRPRP